MEAIVNLYHAIENTANQSTGKPLNIRRYYIQPSHHAPRVRRINCVDLCIMAGYKIVKQNTGDSWDTPGYTTRKCCITRIYSTSGVLCDISEEIIPAHVHAQGHAQQKKKENYHVTRKDVSAVGPSPPLLAPVPAHIPSHGRVVGKDEDDPALAHLVVLLRTTEVGGRRTDAAGRRLQEGGRLLGEGHRLAEGIA